MTVPLRARKASPRELLRLEVPAIVGGAAVLATARYLSHLDVASGPIICPLRRATGIPCPFCGMTTSFSHLAGGRVWQSFVASPMGPVLFAATVVAVLLGLWALFARKRFELNMSDRTRRLAFRAGIVVMVALMVYQNFRIGPLHRLIA